MPSFLSRLGSHLSVAVVTLLLSGCMPPGAASAALPASIEPPGVVPHERELRQTRIGPDGCLLADSATGAGSLAGRTIDLRGNPDFDPRALSSEMACWYEELWRVITNDNQVRYIMELATSDNLYHYSRTINTHISALLMAFRLTGDLALLDEVDRLAQHMRTKLADSWRGASGLGSQGRDGYLNWVWRQAPNEDHFGRDVHATDEMRTHALVAAFAWAFRVNDDLQSPSGVDYRERADFWTRYLVDHFEAKWRERNRVPWPRFPFMERPHMHETVDFVRYHHYMNLLTGRGEYRQEAERLTAVVMANFREAETDRGPALVTPMSLLAEGGNVEYLMPSVYARKIYSDAVELRLEGVRGWSDDLLVGLARALTEFIMDDGSDSFARDIGGGVGRAGLAASGANDWDRFTPLRYVISSFALVSAWDDSGKAARLSVEAYSKVQERLRDVYVPVAMLLDAGLR